MAMAGRTSTGGASGCLTTLRRWRWRKRPRAQVLRVERRAFPATPGQKRQRRKAAATFEEEANRPEINSGRFCFWSSGEGGGFGGGGEETLGDFGFGVADFGGDGGEAGPVAGFVGFGDFEGVGVAGIGSGEGSADFGGKREFGKDLFHGPVQHGIGGGEQAHEEKVGGVFAEAQGSGKLFAEVGTGESGFDEFGSFGFGHGDEGDDGDPAAEFAIAEQSNGVADVVNFGAESENGRIEIAEEAVSEGGIRAEEIFEQAVVKFGCAYGLEQAHADGFAGGDVAAAEHGGLAEEKALVVGVAEGFSVLKLGFGFDFFGEQVNAAGETAV